MRRFLIAAAMALALPACATLPVLGPAPIANATVLDEKVAVSVELAYRAARVAMETGVDAGLIKGVRAAQVASLDNRAYSAVQSVRAAYNAGNAASYSTAAAEAQTAVSAMLSAIKG